MWVSFVTLLLPQNWRVNCCQTEKPTISVSSIYLANQCSEVHLSHLNFDFSSPETQDEFEKMLISLNGQSGDTETTVGESLWHINNFSSPNWAHMGCFVLSLFSSDGDKAAGRDKNSEWPDRKDARWEQADRWVTRRELETCGRWVVGSNFCLRDFQL